MATASISLAPPEALSNKGNLGDNWNKWKQNFKIYLNAAEIDQSSTKATAHFLHAIGQYGLDIFNDLEIPEDASLQEYFEEFDNFCNPKTNLTFNRYQFFDTKQEKKQPFDKFLITLKQKRKNCDFGDLNNSLLMTQIIAGINNIHLRERLLRIPDLDLNLTIEECRATEISEAQQPQKIAAEKTQGKPRPPVQQNITTKAAAPPKSEKKQYTSAANKNVIKEQDVGYAKLIAKCNFCGGSHTHGNCPAFGSTCANCQKPNHYAEVCNYAKVCNN